MTGTQLAALIHRKTKTTTTTYTAADMLVDVNLMKDEIVLKVQQRRPEIFNIIGLQNLVASSTSREYTIPVAALNVIIDLELMFSTGGDYVIATPLARKHYKDSLQESKIVNSFDNIHPRYFIRRKKVYILSGTISAVDDGFRLVYDLLPADLANLTGVTDLALNAVDANGIPKELHELWARRVSIEYKDVNHIRLGKKELDYETDLDKALDDLSTSNLDETIIGALPSGASRGNNGIDY